MACLLSKSESKALEYNAITFILAHSFAPLYNMDIISVIILVIVMGFVIALAMYMYLKTRDIPTDTIGLFMGFAFSKIAQQDYKNTRGYKHLTNLKQIQSKLDLLYQKQTNIISDAKSQIMTITEQKDAEAHRVYADLMVSRLEGEIPHIGPGLAQNMRSICYNGRLEDLRNAQYRVRGIGEQRQYQINVWINNKISQYPSFISNNPSLIKRIQESYQANRQAYEDRISLASQNQANIQKNILIVKSEISQLSTVSEKDFQEAQTNNKTIEPTRMINGIYAPWEPEPIWYKHLLQTYGG